MGKPGPKRGPSKLTQSRQDLIVKAIRAGNTNDAASQYAGIDPTTFYRWMDHGEKHIQEGDEDTKQARFYKAVTRAKAETEIEAVSLIRTAAKKDWRAAAWWLERRRPDQYGDHKRLEITGQGGGPVKLQQETRNLHALMADPAAADALTILAERSAELALEDVDTSREVEYERAKSERKTLASELRSEAAARDAAETGTESSS